MKTTRWVLVAAILASASGASAGERPTADELLAAFEKSVEKLARVRIEQTQKGEGHEPSIHLETTVFRDGPSWKVDQIILPKGANAGGQSIQREQTLIGDEIVRVGWSYRQPGDQPRIRSGLTYFSEHVATRSWIVLGHYAVLFGRMPGEAGLPLWASMREEGALELLPQTEIIDGVETYVLKSRGDFGDHQLWLDPASGALPRRIEIHKQHENVLNVYQLGPMTVPPEEPIVPRQKVPRSLSARWTRIDKIQIEEKNGVFFITGFEQVGRLRRVGRPQQNEEKSREITIGHEFRVDVFPKEFPDDAFQLAIDIPFGTPVFVRDKFPLGRDRDMQLDEWIDRKVQSRKRK